MNAEVKNIFNPEVIGSAVEAAVAGWITKNPEATQEQIQLKRADIAGSIAVSRTKDKFLNSKANRQARMEHLAQAASELGIQFYGMKETVEVQRIYLAEELGSAQSPFLANVMAELLNSIGIPELIEREVTFAVKVSDVEDGHKKVVYSLAAQNPNDERDGLIGRETAIARFYGGLTKTMYLAPGLSNMPMSDVCRHLLEVGVVAAYLNQFKL
jgi:hypothetical protein